MCISIRILCSHRIQYSTQFIRWRRKCWFRSKVISIWLSNSNYFLSFSCVFAIFVCFVSILPFIERPRGCEWVWVRVSWNNKDLFTILFYACESNIHIGKRRPKKRRNKKNIWCFVWALAHFSLRMSFTILRAYLLLLESFWESECNSWYHF